MSLSLELRDTACACGAEGRIRTGTGIKPQRFLRPPRLPFRHFGKKRNGAEDGIRTHDLLLGKEMLYH